MSTIGRAIAIAASAHETQKDKSGRPYIFHPLRMMQTFTDERLQMVAVLHDVVEDSETTLQDLEAEGFSPDIVQAVDHMTKTDDQTYEAYLDRLASNDLARQVKLSDLADNMDLKRLNVLEETDVGRLEKYHRAWRYLLSEDQKRVDTTA